MRLELSPLRSPLGSRLVWFRLTPCASVDRLMCVEYVSVKYDGHIYDCDFNQQVGITQRLPNWAQQSRA